MKKYNIVNNLLGWICFAIAAVTYLLTLEPTASFWDCPEFIAQGAKLEVGHPPGNPIFMLAARFFVTLFGGDITNAAIAVNSMSALLSAATILLLFWTITHLVRKIVIKDDAQEVGLLQLIVIMGAGLCGALTFTWSDTFWFSAVEGEVYAFSSFCTALVFWLILKWENRADQPHSDRYLVLIAYVIGVSIAVHLLNLLCIPAIVLVFYYRKWKNVTAKGSLISLGISFVIVAAILYGLVPGFIEVAQYFEIFFVNTIGWGYNSGVLIYAIVLVALFIWTIITLQKGTNANLIKWQMLLVAIGSGLVFATDSVIVWCIITAAVAIYLWGYCKQVPQRIFNVILLSIFVIFIGYASYALLLIRASASPQMNQNAPDNVFALSSYLNREQYGQRPLMYGPVFGETYKMVQDNEGRPYLKMNSAGLPETEPLTMSDALFYEADGNGNYVPAVERNYSYTKVAKSNPDEPDKYVKEIMTPDYKFSPDLNMILPRVYSMDPEHIKGYKGWSQYVNEDIQNLMNAPMDKRREWANNYVPLYEVAPYFSNLDYISLYDGNDINSKLPVWKASFMDNLRYFFNYQLNHMYWRYFMWNFAGRQNDIQGNGESHLGNWISGIPLLDNARLGDQSLVPARFTTENKGHNVFYMLPLLLGLIGLIWQALATHPIHPSRGIEQFWVIFFLFFMTGIAIVLYLNQTPGQPRERDYAFAGSFYAFAIWIGMGVPAIAWLITSALRGLKKQDKHIEVGTVEDNDASVQMGAVVTALVIGLFVPLQVVSQTWDDHDRSHRYTTRDFGENYLNSLAPNAIIFTNGDNDTFPLWYQQEVEGNRTDVRVINLSYLSTDWYARQMQHPYYESAAVKTTAKSSDYAYDRLSYTRPIDNPDVTPTPALEGLKEFYANGGKGVKYPRMYAPIDSAFAIKKFGINPESPDSTFILPYVDNIEMPALAGGFGLNTLLSFDIVANSIADDFERPVYFACTVPSLYYLGLSPYMYSTGMAQQVTPFRDAESSPLAFQAYENILSKYRWGGLDDPAHNSDLYLDETVRRIVSTTRNSIIDIADELIQRGSEPASEFAISWAKEHNSSVPSTRADMARILLELMMEKLPSKAAPMENLVDLQAMQSYLTLYALSNDPADLARAEEIWNEAMPYYTQLINYGARMAEDGISIGMERHTLQYAPVMVVYKNFIDIAKARSTQPEAIDESTWITLTEGLPISNAVYLFSYGLDNPQKAEDLLEIAEQEGKDTFYTQILRQSAALKKANDTFNIDGALYGDSLLNSYGTTVTDMMLFEP